MAKDYSLLLKARLDPNTSEIKEDIKKLAEKYSLKLMVSIDEGGFSQTKEKLNKEFGGKGGSSKSGIPLKINPEIDTSALSKIKSTIEEIESKANTVSKVKILGDDSGNVKKYALTWTDGLGKISDKTVVVNDKIKSTVQWVQNIAKEELKTTGELEKQNKLVDSQIQKAKEFLARFKGATGVEAEKGRGIAGQIIQTGQARQASVVSGADVAVLADYDSKLKTLNGDLAVSKSALSGVSSSVRSWSAELSQAIKNTVTYAMTTGALYTALTQLKEGIQFIKDLNKEMVGIQMVTGGTDEEINSLAIGYNNLAKEMGATTIEIAKGSLEWVRQGKNAQETSELIKNSTMLSKLGNMSAAESSEALTSIMNGFKMTVEETGSAVDKLVAIDNVASTSSKELAVAIQYSASVANQSGIDFDHLAAYIGTVSAVTRLSSETIGTSMKTISARMLTIKDMKAFDDTGEAINKVEKSLKEVNVDLRDGAGKFKDLQDVIGDLQGRWSTFTKEQQLFISQQIGGKHQYNIILSLLDNQLETEKQLNAERDSANLRLERYAVWQKSVEAAQNRMTASWEKLAMSGATSEMIAGFYDATAKVLDLVNALGGLKFAVMAVSVALFYFNWATIIGQLVSMQSGIFALGYGLKILLNELIGATGAQWAFNLAVNANPYILAATAIIAIGTALYFVAKDAESASEKILRLNKEISDYTNQLDEINKKQESIGELKKKYEELKNILTPTTQESEALLRVQQELKDLVPGLAGEYDSYGRFLFNAKTNMNDLNTATDAQKKAIMELNAEKAKAAAQGLAQALVEEQSRKSAADKGMGVGQGSLAAGMPDRLSDLEVAQVEADWQNYIESSKSSFADWGKIGAKEAQQNFIDELNLTEAGKKLAKDIFIPMMNEIPKLAEPLVAALEEGAKEGAKEGASSITEEMEKALDDILKITIDMIKQQNKAEKDALQDQLEDIKDKADAQKDYYKLQLDEIKRVEDERKTALQREMDDQKRLWDAQKQAIKDQLDAYESIIDKEKELLNLQKEAADFAADKADKESAITKVEQQIAILVNDTSEAGIAQRLILEAQAAEMRKKLAEDEANRTLQLQTEALDAEKQAAQESANLQLSDLERSQQEYEYNHELQLRVLDDDQYAAERRYEIIVAGLDAQTNAQEEALKAQIAKIDDYLEQEGTIRNDAMAMIEDKNSGLYEKLLAWNLKYGSGINDSIVANWDLARQAAQGYADVVSSLPTATSTGNAPGAGGTGDNWASEQSSGSQISSSVITPSESTWWNPFTWHDGIDKGFVGGQPKLKSNEQFAKLLSGEVVVNSQQMESFMAKTLPSMMGQPTTSSNMTGGGAVSFNNLLELNVSGNLDASTIPTIENIVKQAIEKLNSSMNQRGYVRSANSFSI